MRRDQSCSCELSSKVTKPFPDELSSPHVKGAKRLIGDKIAVIQEHSAREFNASTPTSRQFVRISLYVVFKSKKLEQTFSSGPSCSYFVLATGKTYILENSTP